MNRILSCAVSFGSSIVLISGEPVPRHLVEGLASDEFKQREKAQEEAATWMEEKGASGVRAIYQLHVQHDDPEVRNRALKVLRVQSDKEYHKDGQGFLGISMQEEVLELAGDDKPRVCMRITYIMEGSQAELAGLKVGDVITSMDGLKWYVQGAMAGLIDTIGSYKPMKKVLLEVKRAEQVDLVEIPVILGKRPVADMRFMDPENFQQIEQVAREKYFQEWMRNQKLAE
jgi:predicted metalloprotease with PDZ domain